MCGRYLRRSDKQRIAEVFRLREVPEFPVAADYNVAPTTFQPVVRQNKEAGERELVMMRWGLIPFHAQSLAEFRPLSTINARAENLHRGIWKRLYARHRCLVPADGFYEWQILSSARSGPKPARPVKKPWAIGMLDRMPFALGGLWDAWKDPATGEWLQSFAIVTTDANSLMSSIHTRMPVIVAQRDYARWLDRDATARPPDDLLRPFDASRMGMHEAGPRVNSVRNNDPELPNDPTEGPAGLN